MPREYAGADEEVGVWARTFGLNGARYEDPRHRALTNIAHPLGSVAERSPRPCQQIAVRR